LMGKLTSRLGAPPTPAPATEPKRKGWLRR
jgi:hypothetical protein